MAVLVKVYGDTNTLPDNTRDPDELAALERLRLDRRVAWFTSHLVHHEAAKTPDEGKRSRLVGQHADRQPVPKDAKLLGFRVQIDRYTCLNSPMISDVQDETVRAELMTRGLEQRDAEHITQAVCNDCDVFLTRDSRTIIKRHRPWLEQRFPNLIVRLPSELERNLATSAVPKAPSA